MRPAHAMSELRALTQRFVAAGILESIHLRPARGVAAIDVGAVQAVAGRGLEGDRAGPPAARRAARLGGT